MVCVCRGLQNQNGCDRMSPKVISERTILSKLIYAQEKDCLVVLDNKGHYLQVMSPQGELQLLVFSKRPV